MFFHRKANLFFSCIWNLSIRTRNIHVFCLFDERNSFCNVTYCATAKLNKSLTVWCWEIMGNLMKEWKIYQIKSHNCWAQMPECRYAHCRVITTHGTNSFVIWVLDYKLSFKTPKYWTAKIITNYSADLLKSHLIEQFHPGGIIPQWQWELQEI